MFLGAHVRRITGRENIHVWMGECHVHAGIDPENIRLQRGAPSRGGVPDSSGMRLRDERGRGDVRGRRRSRGRADSLDRRDDQAAGALERRRIHRRDGGRNLAPPAAGESEQAILRGERARVVRVHEGHDAARRCETRCSAREHRITVPKAVAARARLAIERMVAIGGGAKQPLSPSARGRRSRGVGKPEGALMEMSEQPHERRTIPRTITPLSVPAVDGTGLLRFPLRQPALEELVRAALEEDGAFNDLTTIATVVSDRRSRATLVRARSRRRVRRAARARRLSPTRPEGVDPRRPRRRRARSRRRSGPVRHRARARAALGRARRAQLHAASVGRSPRSRRATSRR